MPLTLDVSKNIGQKTN